MTLGRCSGVFGCNFTPTGILRCKQQGRGHPVITAAAGAQITPHTRLRSEIENVLVRGESLDQSFFRSSLKNPSTPAKMGQPPTL